MIIQHEPSPALLKWGVQHGELVRSQFPIDSESPPKLELKNPSITSMVTIRNGLKLMFINQMVRFEGSWSPKSGPNRFICSRRSFLVKGRFIAVRSNCATVEKVISSKMF